MKTIYCFIIVVAICITSTGCKNWDAGKRPIDFPNSKWICEEQDIYFTVDTNTQFIYTDENGESSVVCGEDFPIGKMKINGDEIQFLVMITNTPVVTFYEHSGGDIDYNSFNDNNILFIAKAEFSKRKMVLNISEDLDNIFDDNTIQLTFNRDD